MIFVTVGTQKFQMNRLLAKIDELAGAAEISDVYAQIGHSDYLPQNYRYDSFIDKLAFEEKIQNCDLLITHGGVNSIIMGVQHNKPVIVVPRLAKFKEHIDDHQMQIAQSFSKLNYVLMCSDIEKLSVLISEAKTHSFDVFKSERTKMIKILDDYLNKI